MGSDDEMEAPAVDTCMSPDVVLVHMKDIELEDVKSGKSGGMGDRYITDEEETNEAGRSDSASSSEKEFLNDGRNISRSYKQFRYLVYAREIFHVYQSALHIIEILDIDNTSKGAVDTRAQYKSRNHRWFATKKKHESTVGLDEDGNAGEPVNVARDTIVEFMCKRGERETK